MTRTERNTSSALAEELDAYRWVIDPMTPDEFHSKHYEKSVCLIRRGNPSYFSELLSIDQLDRVLTTGLAKYPEISLVQNEKNIRSQEYLDSDDRVDPIRATRLGTLVVTELPANSALGDADAKTLYITARTGLYKVRVNIAGAR